MKLDPFLSRAASLAKKKEYEASLKLLHDEEDRYNGDFKYYYLCGVISLYAGAFLDAKRYLERAQKIKMKDPLTLCGFAVLFLRGLGTRGTDKSRAVDFYLDVLEIDPKNKIANKALSLIRANSREEDSSEWLSQDRLIKLFPPIPAPLISAKTAMIAFFSLAAGLIILSGILISAGVLKNPFVSKNARPVSEYILTQEDKSAPVETGGSYSYILTRQEAIKLYEDSLKLFSSYRDEKAKISLNKLLESNASEGLKNRARILLQNTETPGFDSFKRGDNPSYADVIAEPVLYRDVHVIWRGMAANYEITDEYTRFDFLIGYDTRTQLEGIILVSFAQPVSVNTERPLEVLGRIAVSPSLTGISLEGVAIHQSGRLEN